MPVSRLELEQPERAANYGVEPLQHELFYSFLLKWCDEMNPVFWQLVTRDRIKVELTDIVQAVRDGKHKSDPVCRGNSFVTPSYGRPDKPFTVVLSYFDDQSGYGINDESLTDMMLDVGSPAGSDILVLTQATIISFTRGTPLAEPRDGLIASTMLKMLRANLMNDRLSPDDQSSVSLQLSIMFSDMKKVPNFPEQKLAWSRALYENYMAGRSEDSMQALLNMKLDQREAQWETLMRNSKYMIADTICDIHKTTSELMQKGGGQMTFEKAERLAHALCQAGHEASEAEQDRIVLNVISTWTA